MRQIPKNPARKGRAWAYFGTLEGPSGSVSQEMTYFIIVYSVYHARPFG